MRGGSYWLFSAGDEQVILQTNHDGGSPDEPAEEAFREWPVLLYVAADNQDGLIAKLVASDLQPTLLRASKF